MTHFIVQVKNRERDTLSSALRNEAEYALKGAAISLQTRYPHMAMLMALRCQSESGIDIVHPRVRAEGVSGNTRGHNQEQKYAWDNEKKVIMVAAGMNVELYPGLQFARMDQERADMVEEILKMLNFMLDGLSEIWCPKETAARKSYREHLLPIRTQHIG
jgi:hypothetical protein